MYWTFLFDIANNQIEYAECYQVVNYIQNKKKNSLKELRLLNKVKYAKTEKEKFWSYIMDYPYEDVHNEEKLPVVEENDKIQYVFLVDCSEPNDIVNLIYYCLLEDELNNVENPSQKSILCIKANNNGKGFANIKDLLISLMDEGKINECYFELNKEYQKIKRVSLRRIKQFSPIFFIDESKNSVTYWRQSVDTFLRKQYKVNRIVDKENKYIYGETYFLPHICPKKLKKSDDDTDAFGHKYNLLNTFVESFCGNEHKQCNSADIVKLRYEIWKTEEFFKMVRDMPLLAMYIFCVSNYFSEYKECDNQLNSIMENLRSEIFNARDMADGVLQIIENIYHSEKKRGFFCFRVHSNSEGRSKKYLQEHYKYYMNMHSSENEVTDYLEVKVVDYSHCTITDQFYSNFIKRKEIAEGKDRLIYEKIQKDAGNIKLASFFETNSFWQKYNSISENMVHHYGLQVFDSLVECYDGYFRVRSQKDYEMVSENDVYCSLPSPTGGDFPQIGIPGTQYDVIIPFKKQKIMQNSAVNVNICYTDYLSKEYEVCKDVDFSVDTCRKVTNEVSKNYSTLSYQVKKEKVIYELEEELAKQLKDKVADDRIIRLSAKDLPASMVEIFCKTIVLYIAKNKQKTCYFMITDCTQSHFVEITRILASFYDKQGKNSLMKNNQILLSGEKEGEEFLIVGETLGKVVGSAEKLVFSRSINPESLRILKNMLKNREQGKSSNRMVSIVPFDMVEYDENRPTLFERDLKKVLNTEVQSKEFGCKLENLHVRIGSKIHIRTFYEAELLFHNNYYTSRFAYWLRGEILRNPQLDCKKKITLVGYENYSEMLLSELCDMLKKQGIDIEYIIYEQKATEKFRAGRPLGEYRDSQFVIIIPINSTMTTHIKVVGFLEKTIRREIQKKKDSKYIEYTLPRTEYYGIVLISDKEKKDNNYWTRDKKRNTIISKIDNKKMTYYVEVEAEWLHPLKCGDCFPDEDYTKEVPLVETNKESVIPMQAIGIKKKFDKSVLNISMESEEEKKRLKELSRLLLFDHIERNGNHFSYYFCTEKLWDMPDIQEGVKKWLKQKQNIFTVDRCKVYDIIVAPLHFSNTVFVEIVNRILFGNAALVLHFDVDKEFRMNVKTKYSSLQQLYDNLCEDDEKSIINFHYVDDTIVSGRTFHRTKSLISSLITQNEKSRTEVNLFKSVVLLLNRLSAASIKEYIEDAEFFLTYFNLNISSMRVNADACILCKKHNEWNLLAEQASLNEVYLYWKNKSRNVECKPIEKIRKEKREITSEKQYRAELSMIASHKAKKLLDKLCDCCDNIDIEKQIVDNLFPEITGDFPNEIDELIAMLKVLGRPFLTFRREIKETVFKLMLTMLDALLQNTSPKNETKLDRILTSLWNDSSNRTLMIGLLINRLTELGANYIIRKNSMLQILKYAKALSDNGGTLEGRSGFTNNYLNRIKQLVGQSNDFAKSLYLEYLLLYDEEYKDDYAEKDMVSLAEKTFFVTFKRKAYLENTKLLNYGVEALAACLEEKSRIDSEQLKRVFNETYYLDNFLQYLTFHKMIFTDENGKFEKFTSNSAVEKLKGMLRFQILYQKVIGKVNPDGTQGQVIEEQNLRDKYQEMLEDLRMASGALDAEIIVPYENKTNSLHFEKYIALEFGKKADICGLVNNEKRLNEFIKNNLEFEGDTYTIIDENTRKWVLIKIYDAAEREKGDNISVIYLLFPFDIIDEGEILHSVKNIIVFREKILKMVNLSSSTLLQNWTENLFYKQQMLKSRAVGHSELDSLNKDIEKLAEEICDKREKPSLSQKYFERLVNDMIGFMNSRVLGGKGKDYLSGTNCTLKEFFKGDKKIFVAACQLWDLEIKPENEEELFSKKIRAGRKKSAPELTVLRILVLAVLQNVQKHAGRQEANKVAIKLYEEEGKLCISNQVAESESSIIQEETSEEAYRSGEGISQAVIWDICDSWYGDVGFQETFSLKNDNGQWWYVVKLPILERKGKE